MNKLNPKPCQGKCKLDDSSKTYCIGCERTIGQITMWSKYTKEEVEEILGGSKKKSPTTFTKIRVINKYI